MCSEASTLDITPITPGVTDVLDTRTALVNDEGCRETSGGEQRRESLGQILAYAPSGGNMGYPR